MLASPSATTDSTPSRSNRALKTAAAGCDPSRSLGRQPAATYRCRSNTRFRIPNRPDRCRQPVAGTGTAQRDSPAALSPCRNTCRRRIRGCPCMGHPRRPAERKCLLRSKTSRQPCSRSAIQLGRFAQRCRACRRGLCRCTWCCRHRPGCHAGRSLKPGPARKRP